MIYPKIKAVGRFLAKTALGTCALSVLLGLAYLVGMLRGWDLETVAQFASAVAAMVCTQLGGRSGIPTFGEAKTFLADRAIEIA